MIFYAQLEARIAVLNKNNLERHIDVTRKIAIITGGSRGLGANAALKLAARGTDLQENTLFPQNLWITLLILWISFINVTYKLVL
jgi:hypothetical protein